MEHIAVRYCAIVSVLLIAPEGIFFVEIHAVEESATGKENARSTNMFTDGV